MTPRDALAAALRELAPGAYHFADPADRRRAALVRIAAALVAFGPDRLAEPHYPASVIALPTHIGGGFRVVAVTAFGSVEVTPRATTVHFQSSPAFGATPEFAVRAAAAHGELAALAVELDAARREIFAIGGPITVEAIRLYAAGAELARLTALRDIVREVTP